MSSVLGEGLREACMAAVFLLPLFSMRWRNILFHSASVIHAVVSLCLFSLEPVSAASNSNSKQATDSANGKKSPRKGVLVRLLRFLSDHVLFHRLLLQGLPGVVKMSPLFPGGYSLRVTADSLSHVVAFVSYLVALAGSTWKLAHPWLLAALVVLGRYAAVFKACAWGFFFLERFTEQAMVAWAQQVTHSTDADAVWIAESLVRALSALSISDLWLLGSASGSLAEVVVATETSMHPAAASVLRGYFALVNLINAL